MLQTENFGTDYFARILYSYMINRHVSSNVSSGVISITCLIKLSLHKFRYLRKYHSREYKSAAQKLYAA